MKYLIWTYASFQRNYSSYHLYEGIINAILKRGHEVCLVQMDYGAGPLLPKSLQGREEIDLVCVPYKTDKTSGAGLKQRYIADIAYTRSVYKRVKDRGPFDAALVQSHNSPSIALSYLKRMRVPCVYNEQDIFPLNALITGMVSDGIIYRVAKSLSAGAYKKAAKVITISEDMAQEIAALGCDSRKIETVPNWCRRERNYLVSDEDNAFLKANPSLRKERFRAIYAGNIGLMQNVEIIVDAANLLRGEDIDFVIVGAGNAKAGLIDKASAYSLSNVSFFDSVPEEFAQDIYAAADVNLIPLKSGVIRTCMPSKTAACVYVRRPIIATMDEGTWAEKVINDLPFGLSVPPEDSESLSRAIMVCKEKYGARYRADADNAAEQLFSPDNAERYVDALENAAKDGAR